MKRDRFRCTYCGIPGTDAELEIDHIVAVANGGSNHMSNLTTSCRSCNQKKSDGKPPQIPNGGVFSPRTGGLLGMFLHVYQAGEIELQGHVVGIDEDMVLVEFFSWLTGEPTIVKAVPKATIYSDDCKLYRTAELMNAQYEISDTRRRRWPRSSQTFAAEAPELNHNDAGEING